MAGGIDWFRWHHGSVTDPKFQLVARKAGVRLPDVLAVWAFVLEKASASDERGNFGEIDCEAVDCLFGLDDGQTALILEHMGARGLVRESQIAAWDKRQPKRERDDPGATDRKRNQRARDAANTGQDTPQTADDGHVTPCHATSRQKTPRGEERREEEKREEKDTSSSTVVGAAGAARTAEPKAVALPKDWQLPKAWGDWAMSEFPHWTADIVRLEADKFADHWRGKSGKDARKADWPATWRNWCRSDICQRAHPLRPSGPGMKPGKMTDDERAAWSAAEGEKARRLLFGEAPAADLIEINPTGIPHEAV